MIGRGNSKPRLAERSAAVANRSNIVAPLEVIANEVRVTPLEIRKRSVQWLPNSLRDRRDATHLVKRTWP